MTGGGTVASAGVLTGLTCATGDVLADVFFGDADADAAAAATLTDCDAEGMAARAGLVAASAVAVSVTDAPDAEPSWTETWTVNDAACPRLIPDCDACTLTHSSACEADAEADGPAGSASHSNRWQYRAADSRYRSSQFAGCPAGTSSSTGRLVTATTGTRFRTVPPAPTTARTPDMSVARCSRGTGHQPGREVCR